MKILDERPIRERHVTSSEKQLWLQATEDCQPITKKGIFRETTNPPKHISPKRWDPVLDLHGLTLKDAYESVDDHISHAYNTNWKRITIIPGLSGSMRGEFEHWLATHSKYIKKIFPQRGGGSFEIILKNRDQ